MTPLPGQLTYSANLSMLYADLPQVERPAAAASAGYSYVETWWPFDAPVPTDAERDVFCQALEDASVRLVLLNLDAGDPYEGERGLLSLPGLGMRIEDNLDAVAEIVERTGCGIVNALWGNRVVSLDPDDQDGLAMGRLVAVADRLAPLGVTVVVETLNLYDSPAFPLTDIRDSAEVVRRARARSVHGNLGLLLDTYHLARMGTDPVEAIREHGSVIRHVQFADAPGRGRPRTGSVDFDSVEQALLDIGYQGFVGLEYVPDPDRASDSTIPVSITTSQGEVT